MTMHSLGWIPDVPDARDIVYRAAPTLVLPPQVDLRSGCTPIEDQGALGSCTAQAIVGAVEYCNRRDGLYDDLSRLFVYYEERRREGTVAVDAGAMIRDGIKVIAKTGVPHETYWPYEVARFAEAPPAEAYAHAREHRIRSYERVLGLHSLKASLANRFPVVFGFAVYESFEDDAVARTGIVPLPHNRERMLGGHAVLAVGYDDEDRCVIFRNSWGASWGDEGYGYMPYEFITNPGLSDDFWRVEK